MRPVGFSSGALTRGDFRAALSMLKSLETECIELSALRLSEVDELLQAIPSLDLSRFSYISFHAPSRFSQAEELCLANLLYTHVPDHWNIILHPDAVFDWQCWAIFGRRLAIENMDRRKGIGRTAKELARVFEYLPEASLCFDIGHARQCDASMTEAYLMLQAFGSRLVQVHVSEVNSASQHDGLSYGAMTAFRQVANLIPDGIPVILESRVVASELSAEIQKVRESLQPVKSDSPLSRISSSLVAC